MQILTGILSCLQIHRRVFIDHKWKAVITLPTEDIVLSPANFFSFYLHKSPHCPAAGETRFTHLDANAEGQCIILQQMPQVAPCHSLRQERLLGPPSGARHFLPAPERRPPASPATPELAHMVSGLMGGAPQGACILSSVPSRHPQN